MTLSDYQADLRRAYLGGGIGAAVSGLVWLVAGVVEGLHGLSVAYTALFFGGFAIFPLSTLLEKLFFRRAPLAPGNPGGPLVVETLPAMIGVLLFGFLLIDLRPDWVFPLAAIAVGTHYFPFRTAYGDRSYWVVGALVAAVGAGSIVYGLPSASQVAFAVAAIEIVFGVVLIARNRKA